MNKLIRGLSLALVMSASAGLAGCTNSNESEAQRLQSGLGPVPETTVKDSAPLPPSQYGKRDLQSKGYDQGTPEKK